MLEKLKEVIYGYVGDKEMAINENTVLIADLGLSSLDLVELSCAVEEKFSIEIPDRTIKDFRTVGDMVVYIKKHGGM